MTNPEKYKKVVPRIIALYLPICVYFIGFVYERASFADSAGFTLFLPIIAMVAIGYNLLRTSYVTDLGEQVTGAVKLSELHMLLVCSSIGCAATFIYAVLISNIGKSL